MESKRKSNNHRGDDGPISIFAGSKERKFYKECEISCL